MVEAVDGCRKIRVFQKRIKVREVLQKTCEAKAERLSARQFSLFGPSRSVASNSDITVTVIDKGEYLSEIQGKRQFPARSILQPQLVPKANDF
jgi:hypothetical protein